MNLKHAPLMTAKECLDKSAELKTQIDALMEERAEWLRIAEIKIETLRLQIEADKIKLEIAALTNRDPDNN